MKTTKRMLAVLCVLLVFVPILSMTGSAKSTRNWPVLSVDSPKNSTTKLYVRAIQMMLFRAGIADLNRDGIYGEGTKQCVIDFQKKVKCKPYDGIVGEKTWQAFFKKVVLKETMSGDDVKLLQTMLKKLVGSPKKVTGYFGSETLEAVKKFQSENGLIKDGKVGIKTWTKLFDLYFS